MTLSASFELMVDVALSLDGAVQAGEVVGPISFVECGEQELVVKIVLDRRRWLSRRARASRATGQAVGAARSLGSTTLLARGPWCRASALQSRNSGEPQSLLYLNRWFRIVDGLC